MRRRDEEILFDRIGKAACQDEASGSNDVKETIKEGKNDKHKSTNGINREKNVDSSGGQRLLMKRHSRMDSRGEGRGQTKGNEGEKPDINPRDGERYV